MKIEGINLTADEGKTFIRIHDDYDMGNGIQLGIDTSTGVPREDKPEYYKEVDMPEEGSPLEPDEPDSNLLINNLE